MLVLNAFMLRATVYMHETGDTAIGGESFFKKSDVRWKM